jgi:hypothetical protein
MPSSTRVRNRFLVTDARVPSEAAIASSSTAAACGNCRRLTYDAGEGFFDRGFGHVHRAVARAAGADFYPVYVLPPGSPTQIIPATAPEECTEANESGDDSDNSGDRTDKSDDHADMSDDHAPEPVELPG